MISIAFSLLESVINFASQLGGEIDELWYRRVYMEIWGSTRRPQFEWYMRED